MVNQLEAPFSFATSTARFSDAGRTDDRLVNLSFCFTCLLPYFILRLNLIKSVTWTDCVIASAMEQL